MSIISTLPYTLTNGTTADATQVMSDFNQIVNNVNANAAANGANADITSLSALSTPLSIGQGGTGATTLNAILLKAGGTMTGDIVLKNGNTAVDFASGTLMLFQQTAAPTGWTKQTTHDDKSLRVVSGTASSGGATAFSSVFGSGKTTGAHQLTIAEMPAHTHPGSTGPGRNDSPSFPSSAFIGTSNAATTNLGITIASQGGDGTHTHTLSLDLEYVDLIIASKD